MQNSRLFEITYMLLNQKQCTAAQLATHFEVSVRTIYRDIEALSQAGVPVFMRRGKSGGIALMPGFVLDKSLLERSEQKAVLAALDSYLAVQNQSDTALLDKLSALFGVTQHQPWIEVDYSDWSDTKQTIFETIRYAIIHKRQLEFSYYSRDGAATRRKVDPLRLCFKEKSWYLKAYCQKRKAMRLFKVNRIQDIAVLETFEPHEGLQIGFSLQQALPTQMSSTTIIIHADADQAYRLYDEIETTWIKLRDDGSYQVTLNYVLDDWVIGYLLSFGSKIKVIEPRAVQIMMQQELKKMCQRYL